MMPSPERGISDPSTIALATVDPAFSVRLACPKSRSAPLLRRSRLTGGYLIVSTPPDTANLSVGMESPNGRRRLLASLVLMSPGILWSAYVGLRRAGMAVLYKSASLENGQVFIDVPYREGSTDRKHRLDLFLPQGTGWPTLIFIHGGGLASGDKSFRVSGEDVYGNIGRFYASQGIGVAVINYRLQPKVTWREQVDDVACATAWVATNLGMYGADTSHIFIGGHSAGAHLGSRIALDPKPLAQYGLSPANISGVIAISGAGYDLADNETYELGRNRSRY